MVQRAAQHPNGRDRFRTQFGMSYFNYLAQHPESDRIFNQAMTGYHDAAGTRRGGCVRFSLVSQPSWMSAAATEHCLRLS
jgi:hypothetical protein